ncbi:MAG: tetratricopeptide repeat protein [Desulfovibrio sp.]|jgi:tetratricopeptide (TPR) repeat protein|nr:tetratricopeptide repeat protein [Desulfovibrio sp.]
MTTKQNTAEPLLFSGRPRAATFLIQRALMPALFALLLCLYPAQAAQNRTAPAPRTTTPGPLTPDISAWGLSLEAQHLFYYLALSQALLDNSHEVVTWAIRGLLRIDPSLPVFQDSAAILLSRGEYELAEKTALDGLAKFADNPLLYLLLSGTYNERGQGVKAVEILENALKKNPGNLDLREEMIRLYLREGENDKAANLLPPTPDEGDAPEAELFRAGVLSTVGRTEEAKSLLLELVKKEPDFASAWLELAFLAEREGNSAEALAAYGKAIELAPENQEAQLRIITLLVKDKKPDEAMRTLDEAHLNAHLLVQAALRFADGQYYPQAELLLEQAKKAGASPDEVALFLSMVKLEGAKDPKSALSPLMSIKAESPIYPAALEQKARVYLRANDWDRARATAHEGRKLFPERKDLWGIEAFSLARQKKNAKSEAVLKEALNQYPGDEDLLLSLGNIQEEGGNKKAAMQTMEQLLAINPKNYQAQNYIGYSLADSNTNLVRALELISSAFTQNPEADFIADSLAWVLYRLGRHAEAWETIKRCISLGGDDAVIWEHYGDIALAVGDKNQAVKGYKEAIQRKAQNLNEVRRKLTKLGK